MMIIFEFNKLCFGEFDLQISFMKFKWDCLLFVLFCVLSCVT